MEVKSGVLICPTAAGVPKTIGDSAEMKYMEELINTYGKVKLHACEKGTLDAMWLMKRDIFYFLDLAFLAS